MSCEVYLFFGCLTAMTHLYQWAVVELRFENDCHKNLSF